MRGILAGAACVPGGQKAARKKEGLDFARGAPWHHGEGLPSPRAHGNPLALISPLRPRRVLVNPMVSNDAGRFS